MVHQLSGFYQVIRSRFYSILSILLFSFTCQTVLAVSEQKERPSHKQAEENHIPQQLLACMASLPDISGNKDNDDNIFTTPQHRPVPDEFIVQFEYFFIKAETVLKNRFFQKGEGNKSPQNGEKAINYSQYFPLNFFPTSINKSCLIVALAQTKEERHNIAQQVRARERSLRQYV